MEGNLETSSDDNDVKALETLDNLKLNLDSNEDVAESQSKQLEEQMDENKSLNDQK